MCLALPLNLTRSWMYLFEGNGSTTMFKRAILYKQKVRKLLEIFILNSIKYINQILCKIDIITKCGLVNAAPSNITSKSINSSAKIVGGTETLPNEFPWQALLILEQTQGSARYACGGSLIGNQWVLTAAHCLDKYVTYP